MATDSVTPMMKPKELGELATIIKEAHADVEAAGRNIINKAFKAGGALIEAKRQVGHGHWLVWLRDNCGVSERRAQDYMKLAANRSKIEAEMKSAPTADLSLKWALGLIKQPPGDGNGSLGKYEKARTELIKKLRALEPGDVEDAAQATIVALQEVVVAVKSPTSRAA